MMSQSKFSIGDNELREKPKVCVNLIEQDLRILHTLYPHNLWSKNTYLFLLQWHVTKHVVKTLEF